nr:hypothetical protein [Tanacetum cinerariifolium]
MQTHTSNAFHNAIMEAGGKDRPPMLAPGNYVKWKSIIKRYIDTKPNNELIHYCLQNPPYEYKWADKDVLVAESSTETTTVRYMENYKNVSQDIRDQLNAEAEAKAIERLKQDESIHVQDLETNLYWEFGKFTSWDGESLESYYSRFYKMMNELVKNQCDVTNHQQHQNEVNEIRAERQACTTNPLALVAQQQPVYHPQNYPTHYAQNSSTRSRQAATRNRGKAIVNSPPPTYYQEPYMVAEDDEMSKDKEIDKLMALISLSFKKIYKPTNNNIRTSSNTSRANQNNSPRINSGTGNDNQRIVNVAGARENAEQADWRDDTDDELEDQELKAHYMYMAQLQEVTPDAVDNSGPILVTEPLQKVSNNDNYNVFAIEREHPEQSKSVNDTYPIEQDEHNVIIDSLDMSYDREQVDQDNVFAIESEHPEQSKSVNDTYPIEQDEHNVIIDSLDMSYDREQVDQDNVFAIESEHPEQSKSVNDTYPIEQDEHNVIIDSLDMSYDREQVDQDDDDDLANERDSLASLIEKLKCEIDDSKHRNKFLKTSNKALVDKLKAPKSDEVIRLEKESRSKLSDLIRPFDYEKLNNLYDLFVPQREKSSAQRYFSERSKISHTPINNENTKESFNKQTTLLEKRMDESIP